MTPFERRLQKVEAERNVTACKPVEVRFWDSPPGMTDLTEQSTWLAEQTAVAPPIGGKVINVHFIRHQRPAGRAHAGR